MKKLLILFTLVFFSLTAFSQNMWSGFFKPSSELKTVIKARDAGDTNWGFHFRPAANMNAIQFTYDKDEGAFKSSTFSSGGLGFGLQHYVEKDDGTLVNNYGLNALLILDASQSSQGSMGIALTINALQFISAGGGYAFQTKQWFILTGVVYHF